MSNLTWVFIREAFDGRGSLTWGDIIIKPEPECRIYSFDEKTIEEIAKFANIPYAIVRDESPYKGGHLCYTGANCIDFLGNVYKRNKYISNNYVKYCKLLTGRTTIPKCLVYKDDERAVIPSKTKESDAGYDLTIIKEHKRLTYLTIMFDTGIKIKLDHGYYAEVVPRSSLAKSGYILANGVGIIDQSYRGNIYITLTKVDPSSPNIELPNRCCQLIIRRQVHVDMGECQIEDLDNTFRGDGGFGSTN